MSDQPIHVSIEVAGQARSITLVGNPDDSLLAHQIGRAVSVAILECGEAIRGD